MRVAKVKVYSIRDLERRAKSEDAKRKRSSAAEQKKMPRPWRKAFDRAVEDLRHTLVEHDWWNGVYDQATSLLDFVGFRRVARTDIQFTGFGSQGDGASFTCKTFDFERLHAAAFGGYEAFERIKRIVERQGDQAACSLVSDWPGLGQHVTDVAQNKMDFDGLGDPATWAISGESDQVRWFDAVIERVNSQHAHSSTCNLELTYRPVAKFSKADEKLIDVLYERLNGLRVDLCRWIYRHLEKEHEHLTSDESVIDMIEANGFEFRADGQFFRE